MGPMVDTHSPTVQGLEACSGPWHNSIVQAEFADLSLCFHKLKLQIQKTPPEKSIQRTETPGLFPETAAHIKQVAPHERAACGHQCWYMRS